MSYNWSCHENIPEEYRIYWRPYVGQKILFHLTTGPNWESIKSSGWIEPRDPAPRRWAGMSAVYMSDPDDPIYFEQIHGVLNHVRTKHDKCFRLHIKTDNHLYKSIESERTFQVISLEPISASQIVKVEEL